MNKSYQTVRPNSDFEKRTEDNLENQSNRLKAGFAGLVVLGGASAFLYKNKTKAIGYFALAILLAFGVFYAVNYYLNYLNDKTDYNEYLKNKKSE